MATKTPKTKTTKSLDRWNRLQACARSTMKPRTVIVVPCYNEEKRVLVESFRRFASRRRDIQFIFVDDGSTDGTLNVLATLQDINPDAFTLHSLPANRGKAEAVRQGMLRAFKACPEYVGYWDADLSTPLEAIPAFVKILEGFPDIDLVTGARVQLLGRRIKRRGRRHYIGRIFATAVSLILRLAVYDTQCGAKVFRVKPSVTALFSKKFVSSWIFDVEIIARMIEMQRLNKSLPVDRVIYEYPLVQWIDVSGSKVGFRAYVSALVDLLKIFSRYRLTHGTREASKLEAAEMATI